MERDYGCNSNNNNIIEMTEMMESDPKLVAELLPAIVQREPKSPIPPLGEPWPGAEEAEYHPLSQPTPPRYSYMDEFNTLIKVAIEYYNKNHQNDPFELVDPLLMRFISPSDWRIGNICHLSFTAKSKKSSSKVKLFFAEIGAKKCVKICSVVDPGNPLVETGCGVCHPDGVIYHPFVEYDWSSEQGYFGRLSTIEACAKRLFREAYTIKSTIEDLDGEDAYELKKMINGHALKALEMYNSENDSFYELLELVSCTRFVCEAVSYAGDFWAHLVFVAEVKDCENSSVHFFAEVGFDVDMVTSCVIIPTHDSVSLSGNVSQCAVCPNVCPMFHPVGKYVAGYYGGTFADSMYNGKFRAVKSEILLKDNEASRATRHALYEFMQPLEER